MTDAAHPEAAPARPPPRWLRALKALRHRKMAAMLLLALAAGLPYGAVLGTLNAWLTAEGITPREIGVLNFIILAYSFKLIWAPGFQKAWFPKIGLPWLGGLGPRRAWLLSLQILMAVLLGLLALSQPATAIGYVALISVIIAISSATHDMVLDAWRIEVAETDEDKDLMSALYQFGYRIAGLFTGLFALTLADHIPWSAIYGMIAVGMAVTSVGTLVAREPDHSSRQVDGHDVRPTYAGGMRQSAIRASVGVVAAGWALAIAMIVWFVAASLTMATPPSTASFTLFQAPLIVTLSIIVPGVVAAMLLRFNATPVAHGPVPGSWTDKAADALFHTILDPLMDFVQRFRWAILLMLFLVLSYRFVDLIWGGFAYPFYLGENFGALGHSNTDVAIASKTIGVFMTIAGAAVGGAALIFIGRLPCLVIGAFISAITNLLFADLASGAAGMTWFLSATGLDGVAAASGMDVRLMRLIVAIAGENLAGGFASVAFVAYLTSIVNPKFAMVQYALLGSLTMLIGSLGRAELGVYIETAGFHDFFVLTAWLGMIAVGLAAAEWLRQLMTRKKKDVAADPAAAPQPAE